ncbi:MAG: hypothetical protein JNK67_16125 [Alphaproteobacteria bacterium]|nr:hypothetical protein [Alphaproteobacteria bacterium]
MTQRVHFLLLGAAALLAACANGGGDGPPATARQAQARFDTLCAARPDRATIDRALLEISGDQAIETVGQRDLLRAIPWHLRPAPPGTASALKGGGRRWSSGGIPLFGASFVAAAVYLDGEGRVLGCRSTLLHDGP